LKKLYFDCFSGVSGDMIVGSLLHLGLELQTLENELRKLPIKGYKLEAKPANRSGIEGYKFNVILTEKQVERRLKDIKKIIVKSKSTDRIKKTAFSIFEKLAEVEATIHGVAPEEIHFHEIGGVDSIIDIVGSVIGIDLLGIDEIYSSAIPFSRSRIKMEHGIYPGPAPAVLELLRGVEMYESNRKEELVTPTGAAILSVLSKQFGRFPRMKVSKIGYGSGDRNPRGTPNVLRAIMGENDQLSQGIETDRVVVTETNIDDMSPEAFDNLFDKLLSAEEVLDVSLINTVMKRGRPGQIVKIISRHDGIHKVSEILFRDSTTIGVRYYDANRFKLRTKQRTVSTKYGDIRVKIANEPELGIKRAKPEYEDCKKAAKRHKVSLREVYDEVTLAIGGDLSG
jgi:pyridinium-3,5-bisthiocarboxylic acid mononucleotide nickel chelatase